MPQMLTATDVSGGDTFDGAAPVLLLDEVAAHLDEVRRSGLMSELMELGSQTWMTGTDEDLFSAASGCIEIYRVSDGQISRAEAERKTA